MKQLLILSMVLFSSIALKAQADTLSIEQYCQVIATPGLFSNKVTIDIDFGEEKSIWRYSRLKTYDGKLKKFNTVVDALNYIGKDGWVFINAYPVRMAETTIYHFAFKNQFPKSAIQY